MAMANVVAEWAKERYEFAVKIAYENGSLGETPKGVARIVVR